MTSVAERDKPVQACLDLTHLFFSPEEDGRTEVGRSEREAMAKQQCFVCAYRLGCLEKSLVWKEELGVWGGMGEGERRRFAAHLKQEGYTDEVPTGPEFRASLRSFYRSEGRDRDWIKQNVPLPRRRRLTGGRAA